MAEIDSDLLIDRRRLKRQITLWRVLAIVALVAVAAVAVGRAKLIGGGPYIARLNVQGLILDDPARLRTVARAAEDNEVAAVVLRIDSPGGTVVGGEALFRQLRQLAEKKPLVAVMGEVAASGGYMVALSADHILAREGTITGSIGVVLQTTDVTGLLGKLGITTEAIKSAPLKAVPSPLEPLTEEGRQVTRSLVADMFAMFVDLVRERRKLGEEGARRIADGRVFTGRQARELGLIDAIGGEKEAIDWLVERGVRRRLPVKDLKIEREDGRLRDLMGEAIALLAGKTYLPERLTLDGLVAVWHPDLGSR